MKKIVCFILLTLISCKSAKTAHSGIPLVTGKLVNMTGLDGCGWIIQLDENFPDGSNKLEPLNLQEHKIDLKEGLRVELSYEETGGASVCMVGKMVNIKVIRARK